MAEKKTDFYQVKKTIGGVAYTAQFSGLSTALDIADGCQTATGRSSLKMARRVLSDVVVEPPGLGVDDFEDMEMLMEVVAWAYEVSQGKFRDGKNKSAADRAG